jgi:hypothetical protein
MWWDIVLVLVLVILRDLETDVTVLNDVKIL